MHEYVDKDGTFEYGDYYFRNVKTSGENVYYCDLPIEFCMDIVGIQRANGNISSTCEECVDIYFEMCTLFEKQNG